METLDELTALPAVAVAWRARLRRRYLAWVDRRRRRPSRERRAKAAGDDRGRRRAAPIAGDRHAGLSDDQRTEVEAIIQNYLIAHPEIIRDAINELQRREDAAAAEQQAKAIADNKALLFNPRARSCSATRRATSRWSSSSTTTAPIAGAPRPT